MELSKITNLKAGAVMLAPEALGIYTPRQFVRNFHIVHSNADNHPGWKGISEWAQITCENPEDPDYWEAWNQILDNAKHVDANGHEWTLWQDGDLWMVCPELIKEQEKFHFGFTEGQ